MPSPCLDLQFHRGMALPHMRAAYQATPCLTCGLLLPLRELISSAISRSPGASVSSCGTGSLRRLLGGGEGARQPVSLLRELVLRFLKAPALQRQHVSHHCFTQSLMQGLAKQPKGSREASENSS